MFEIKLIFLPSTSRMLKFSQFVWTPCYSVRDDYNNFLLIDATDRSKISGHQKRLFIALSLYPLSFFANTPFNHRLVSNSTPFHNLHFRTYILPIIFFSFFILLFVCKELRSFTIMGNIYSTFKLL